MQTLRSTSLVTLFSLWAFMSASFFFPLFVTGVPTPTMIYSTRVTNNLNEALRVTVNFADFNNDVKSETKNIQPKQSDQFGPEYFKSGGATFRYEVDTLSFRAVDTDKAGYDHEMTRADLYEGVASIVPLMEVSISPDNSNSKGFTVATSVPADADLK